MAIVEMKRISLLALKKDKEALLAAMQRMGCIQITELPAEEAAVPTPGAESLIKAEGDGERVRWALAQLGRYDTAKKPLLGGKPEVSAKEAAAVLEEEEALLSLVAAVEECERRRGELRGSEARIHAAIEQLQPWMALDVPAERLHDTRDTVQRIGTMPKAPLEAAADKWQGQPVYMQPLETVRDMVYVHILAHRSVAEDFLAELRGQGFTPATLGDIKGRPAEQRANYHKQLEEIAGRYGEIEEELKSYAPSIAKLKIYHDIISARRDRLAAAERFASTKSAFYMEGWVPKDLSEKVTAGIHEISPSAAVDVYDPEEGDEPPVLLHNNKVVAPFESVVSGFSLPAPGGIDPTAVMMPFFVNFFGMMVSDAGYGLVLAIAIPFLIKYMNPSPGAKNLMKLLAIGGVATVIWGFLYNTWFGFSPLPTVFDAVNNPMPVMGICIGLGAIHLFAGLGMAAYMNIKRGHVWDAVFDQLSWFLLILGAIIMLVPGIAQGLVLPAALSSAANYMALAGVAIILFTAGRHKGKNPIKRLIGGLGALYGVTSWVSDLLSYIRLFGMGLATGVIGMVINQLVGMVMGGGIIGWIFGAVIFVGAHAFNAGINILGAYVHSCRLQYIEFFGKFYEDGGKPFTPLSQPSRYVYIKDATTAN